MGDLFSNLPFTQAIEALRERLAVPKETFESWDAANRSRAFTMARVADLDVLQSIHDEISQAITEGETYADFEKRMQDVQDRTGWTGSDPWHYRLVYDQNLGMAYSAGSVEQGRELGMKAWRYLPSLSDHPRPEHEIYYDKLFRFEPGSPVPPLDFGCACGWEWVFPEELDGVDVEKLPVFNPPRPASGYAWNPAAYSAVGEMPSVNKASAFSFHLSQRRINRQDAKTQSSLGDLDRWSAVLTDNAASIGARKFAALREWMQARADAGLSLAEIQKELSQAAAAIAVPEEIEMNAQALLFAWLKGASTVEQTMKKNRNKAADVAGLTRLICEPISVDGIDGPALLIPWGTLKRADNQIQIVDAESAKDIIREFNSRRVDMVIDFEHQSEGGEFASPDGLAPAAGWVKQGSLAAVPGKGIYGQVSWTKRAGQMIANREYRYLSPVTFVDRKTNRVKVLDKVALTNTPAIEGFPPLVNKSGAAIAPESETRMDALLAYLREVLGMDAAATPEDILAKMKGSTDDTSTATEAVANKATASALLEVAAAELADAGGSEIAAAAKKGDKAGLTAALRKSINRMQHPVGKVDAAEYNALKDRLATLESRENDRECDALILTNSNRIPPTERDGFRKLYAKDPEFAKTWLAGQPERVANKSTPPADKATPASDRNSAIVTLRNKFRESPDLAKVCSSERSFVDGQLRASGQKGCSDDEARTLAIVG